MILIHTVPSSGRQAFKTANNLDFFVEHLSGLEYHMRLAEATDRPEAKEYLLATSKKAAGQCDAFKPTSRSGNDSTTVFPSYGGRLPCSVGITPFWGGYGGAAHSTVALTQRQDYLRGTVCSMAKHVENIVIGACKDWRREGYGNMTDAEIVRSTNLPVPFELVELECGKGTYLITRSVSLYHPSSSERETA